MPVGKEKRGASREGEGGEGVVPVGKEKGVGGGRDGGRVGSREGEGGVGGGRGGSDRKRCYNSINLSTEIL